MTYRTLSILALFLMAAPFRIVAQVEPPKFQIFGETLDHSPVWEDVQWNCIRWANIGDSLRLNLGTLRIHEGPANDMDKIRGQFSLASEHNGLRFNVQDPDREGPSLFSGPLKFGRRRLYHPECSWHYSLPDTTLKTSDILANAEADASLNIRIVHASTEVNPTPRIIVSGLAHSYGVQRFPTGGPMYMRARLKRDMPEFGATLNDTLCALLVVKKSFMGSTPSDTLLGRATIFAREVQQSRFIHSDSAVAFNPAAGDTLDYQVYWPGRVGVSIDYIAIDNDSLNRIFQPDVKASFDAYIDNFFELGDPDLPQLRAIRLEDELDNVEIDSLRYPVMGLFNEHVKNRRDTAYASLPADLCTTSITVAYHNKPCMTRRYLRETGCAFLLTDFYPWDEDDVSEEKVQIRILVMTESLGIISSAARTEERPWMAYAQVSRYGQPNNLREPNVREIAVQANIHAAMGAKGVGYYWFQSYTNGEGLLVRGLVNEDGTLVHEDSLGDLKVNSVRDVNLKLEKIGPVLMNLTWQNSATGPGGLPTLELNDSIRVTNVVTRNILGVADDDTAMYYHIGWLRKTGGDDDYLYLVNTRTVRDSSRRIALAFDSPDGSILIESADSSKGWVIRTDSVFAEKFAPGDGRLYRVRKAEWSGNAPLDTVTTVTNGSTLRIKSGTTVTLGAGQLLDIQSGATVVCEKDAYFKLLGGKIRVQGGLVLNGSNSFRGKGTIEGNGVIVWTDSMRTEWNDTLTFTGGMTFYSAGCAGSISHKLENYGRLVFEGPSTYAFLGCLDTILVGGGSMELQAGVTFENTPNVVDYPNTVIISQGTDNDSCKWLMRDTCQIDIYGTLRATNTVFDSYQTPGSETYWDGILFGYENAYCDIDNCQITGIRMLPDVGGSALHFYAATDTGNHVCNTMISRNDYQTHYKNGDAVFMQPGLSESGSLIASELVLACDSIRNDWYTGLSSVGSNQKVYSTKILNNTHGVSADDNTHTRLERNCIEGSGNIGVRLNNQAVAWLGLAADDTPGQNRIINNDSVQCKVMGGSILIGGLYFQQQYLGGENHISADDTSKLRVAVVDAGAAALQNEYWGPVWTVNDTTAGGLGGSDCYIPFPGVGQFLFSSDPQSSLLYNPVNCYPQATACDGMCEGLSIGPFHKTSSLPPYATDLYQLTAYARRENFAEVYRYLVQFSNQHPERMMQAASLALALEREHAMRYQDSTATCRNRILSFLNNRYSLTNSDSVRAGLLALMANASFSMGDLQACEASISQLRSSFPASRHSKRILKLLLSAAMAKRDDAQVNYVLQNIIAANLDPDVMHSA